MKKLFVSHKLAVLAKKKGFNKKCLAYYDSLKKLCPVDTDFNFSRKIPKNCVAAPTYQQVVDWFRIKHKILIHQVLGFHNYHWCFKIQNINKSYSRNIGTIQEKDYYTTFKEAIKEAFKSIK